MMERAGGGSTRPICIPGRKDMRSHLFTCAAALALVFLAISPANPMTITAPAETRRASDALDLTEAVDCRDYAHRHKRGHARGLGCDVETEVIAPRSPGVVTRGSGGAYNPAPLVVEPLRPVGRPSGNYFNPSNPQDRSGNSNPQDMTQPRAFNPQDMR
jgi:hypothetical protein